MKNKQHTLPSFFLISSAVDGNENAIEKLCSMKPIYQNAVYARFTMNTATYTLWLIWN